MTGTAKIVGSFGRLKNTGFVGLVIAAQIVGVNAQRKKKMNIFEEIVKSRKPEVKQVHCWNCGRFKEPDGRSDCPSCKKEKRGPKYPIISNDVETQAMGATIMSRADNQLSCPSGSSWNSQKCTCGSASDHAGNYRRTVRKVESEVMGD